MEKFIRIKDRDTVLEISYEDMIKYHGCFNIGGVALAFKALELGLSELVPDDIPMRCKIRFNSALGAAATGVVDGVEMATRALSRGCLTTDMTSGQDIIAPVNPDGGKFYFEITYGESRLGLAVKEGMIPEEFTAILGIALERPLNQDEAQRLQEVKKQIAASVISMEGKDLFNLYYY